MIGTVIIGTGAAGVSAAWPLAEAGIPVTLLDPDPGGPAPPALPDRPYLEARRGEAAQWRWLLDPASPPASLLDDTSPKFRAPTLAHVFAGHAAAQGISTEGFHMMGSLAAGGMTLAWGAGAAAFTAEETAGWPVGRAALEEGYRRVARRAGISGAGPDDLSEQAGLDGVAAPGVPLDAAGRHMQRRWEAARPGLLAQGFRLGRARLAVLREDAGERRACAELGLCLWGCPRRAIWSAAEELAVLRRHPAVTHRSGAFVEHLSRAGEGWALHLRDTRTGWREVLHARRVVLAAGAIGSARLALGLHGGPARVPLLSSPTAAFALLLPALLGRPPRQGSELGQHLFALGEGEAMACGVLFPTTGLPLAEFVARAPLSRALGIRAMRWLLPATVVGNAFFHSRYSAHSMAMDAQGRVVIQGGFAPDFAGHLAATARRLRPAFRRLGGIALPGSFAPGAPGSDLHYAGTLPMRAAPGPLECDAQGALAGAPGIFVADGAALPGLPGKSHTLTIMAWADRLGRHLAAG